MKKFSKWLSIERNYLQVSPVEIQVLYNDLNTNEVSMHGNGIFALTYTVVANVNNF